MKRIYVFYLLLAVSFASCKTSFRISVQEPAAIRISKDVTKYGVLNSVTISNSPEDIAGSILGGQSPDATVVASERAMDGIYRSLERSGYLSGTEMNTDSVHQTNGEVNWEFIDRYCQENNLDGIIEIAELKTISPLGGTVLANLEGKRKSRLDGTAYMNYYIAGSHDSYERFQVRYSYNIPLSEGQTLIDILSDIQKRREYYRRLGFELGYKAGKMIYPNWVWVNRKFYNKGSKEIKRAKPMIYKGNWDIAEKQLMYAIEAPSDKARGRAYYNLALVKEGQGYIDEAIKNAEIAALEYGDKMANEYLVQLRKRKRQIDAINAQ